MASVHVKSCLVDLNLHSSEEHLEQTESPLKAEAMSLFSSASHPPLASQTGPPCSILMQ